MNDYYHNRLRELTPVIRHGKKLGLTAKELSKYLHVEIDDVYRVWEKHGNPDNDVLATAWGPTKVGSLFDQDGRPCS